MASVEISPNAIKKDLQPAPAPQENAWKTPLVRKLHSNGKDTPPKSDSKNEVESANKEKSACTDSSTPQSENKENRETNTMVETPTKPEVSKVLENSISEKENVKENSCSKETSKESSTTKDIVCNSTKETNGPIVKPKIFDNVRFVEAPPPKVNPWLKKPGECRCKYYSHICYDIHFANQCVINFRPAVFFVLQYTIVKMDI